MVCLFGVEKIADSLLQELIVSSFFACQQNKGFFISINKILSSGQIASTNVNITPAPVPTVFATTATTTIYFNEGKVVNFFGTNYINADSYLWAFADGTTSSLRDPQYTFVNGGTEDVILTILLKMPVPIRIQ